MSPSASERENDWNNLPTKRVLLIVFLVLITVMTIMVIVLAWSLGRSHRENRILRMRGDPMEIDVGSNKVKMRALSEEPWIVELSDFLTKDECNHLIKLGENAKMTQSKVGTTYEDSENDDSSRNSFTSFLIKGQDETVKKIEQRCAIVANHPITHIEPLQIVRYKPGQFFKEHHDYFKPTENDKFAPTYQRTITIFIYLNDLDKDEEGGKTTFPKAGTGVSVTPKMGKAVLFRNTTPDGIEDELSLHGGQKLNKCTKYGCNVWFTSKKYQPPIKK